MAWNGLKRFFRESSTKRYCSGSSRREVFCKKGVLRNFAKFTKTPVPESLYNKVACNFIKKETLVQLFSCEFCKIPNSTFSYRTPPVAASAVLGKRFLALPGTFYKVLNPLSSKLSKWSNTFKQFVWVWVCLTILWGWRLTG